MTHLNEEIARVFFEISGFLVRSNLPYRIGKGSPDSDIDLLIQNTAPTGDPPREMILSAAKLQGIHRAIVEVKGYHTERFSPSILDERMFRFTTADATRAAEVFFKGEPFKRLFILSRLPTSKASLAESLEFMSRRKVDHVLEFRTLLETIVEWVKAEPDYDSNILQAIRILKSYGLIPSPLGE